jgi:hypothetical protein
LPAEADLAADVLSRQRMVFHGCCFDKWLLP